MKLLQKINHGGRYGHDVAHDKRTDLKVIQHNVVMQMILFAGKWDHAQLLLFLPHLDVLMAQILDGTEKYVREIDIHVES